MIIHPEDCRFQPTSPVRETTFPWFRHHSRYIRFQPTSPVRETTEVSVVELSEVDISTHVPRAGDDPRTLSPAGPGSVFQPTSPVRETTVDVLIIHNFAFISTHVPRAGDDTQA